VGKLTSGSAAESVTVVETSLARLRELALAIPRPGCDWEERPRFDPPASPEEVAAFERAAGFPLPADLRAFLADAGAVVGMSVHNGYWVGGVEQLVRAIVRGDFPPSVSGEPAAPVATDGGGNAFLLSSSGRVWRLDHETWGVSEVAASFAGFLERVAADWSAFVADTPGWRFLV
jgi:hypothetical protein